MPICSNSSENLSSPPKEVIRGFFDRIAFRYDSINSLLSMGLDEVWRKKAVRLLLNGEKGEQTILDLGVGTGKFLNRFLEGRPWKLAVGIDFSNEMLRLARGLLSNGSRLLQADIHNLPFADESFDVVVSSFTLRSVKDRLRFFSEIWRILKPKGKVGLLDLTRPNACLARWLYGPYLRFYLPCVGWIFSADAKAYQFLSQSIQTFPAPSEIASQLESFGFRRISAWPFTFGISTLLMAQR